MHNRVKSTQPFSETESAILLKKCQNYKSLVELIFERKVAKDYSSQTLDVVGKVLRNNPDFYTLWNMRREQLLASSRKDPLTGKLLDNSCDEELKLSADGIMRNPKSYGAWYHRVWVLDHFDVDHTAELSLCKDLLKEDQRNFHCWNYRRFLINHGGLPGETEMEFTSEKIQENFSNYSAFHQRSVFIRRLGIDAVTNIADELRIVENAVFTEPDDQSAWWYHQFLLNWAAESLTAASQSHEWFHEVCWQQLELMRSLMEIETACRWVMTCILNLLDHLERSLKKASSITTKSDEVASIKEERLSLLAQLQNIDPMHAARYQYLLRKATVAQNTQ